MKIAYLVLAHNHPAHLQRMLYALSSPSAAFFIHIDKKVNFKNHDIASLPQVVMANNRFEIYHSHFSQVEAIHGLIDQALNYTQTYFDRFVLLSGTDYPLRSADYIETFFERNPTIEFMNLVEIPNKSEGKPLSRITTYKPTPTFPFYYLERMVRGPIRRIGLIPRERNYRKYLKDMTPYGGAEWWALTRDACRYLRDFVMREQAFVGFFRHSQNPEEMFFHTILGNSPFRSNITNFLTYTDWSAGGGHPAWITMEHLTKFHHQLFDINGNAGKGEFLFARKFSDASKPVVDALDRMINELDDNHARVSKIQSEEQ